MPEESELKSNEPAGSRTPISRRLLFATAATGIAGAAVVSESSPAQAASPSSPWVLGGNSISTDGSNFLGPTNADAPLIFKTRNGASGAVSEKMRLTAPGLLGLGTAKPSAKLDVLTSGVAVRGTTTSTASTGRGIVGTAPSGFGVEGNSTSGNGLLGTTTNGYGAQCTSTNNVGVYGTGGYAALYGTGGTYGVVGYGSYGAYFSGSTAGVSSYGGATGVSASGTSTGVYGSGPTGVSGYSSDPNGNAVYGNGGQYGVHGVNGRTAGVRGDSGYVGVWAEAPTYGLNAIATGTSGQNYGIYTTTASSAGFALYAAGNVAVAGTLSKSAGSFKIDHPLDPDNKWLSHSFVESPDMMNVYNGNVTTDGGGGATVTLPDYFGALNRDFRYQLTVIGDFAQAIVSQEVTNNAFAIKTDKPNIKVSWQVTGIRQDPYAVEHPIVVETQKAGADKGERQFLSKGSNAKGEQTAPSADNDGSTPSSPPATPEPKKLAPM